MPQGAGTGNGSGGAKGIKGTIASAGFGNGIAQGGQGDGRSSGRGATVQTAGFGEQTDHAWREPSSRTSPRPDLQRHLVEILPNQIRFTLTKHATSGSKVKCS